MVDDETHKEWPYRYRMFVRGADETFAKFSATVEGMHGKVIGDSGSRPNMERLITVGMKTHVRPEDLDRTATDSGLELNGRTTQLDVPGDHILLGTKHPR